MLDECGDWEGQWICALHGYLILFGLVAKIDQMRYGIIIKLTQHYQIP